ncbi:unnamed protein product [Amoebophrya sp. A120]|nr:unnamed protein product [Amoebophrya sp. A120]|eukprot:GSA120T00006154001.1
MPTVASGPGGPPNLARPSAFQKKDGFYAGQSVEYYSKSAGGKWIGCVVREVQTDGTLVLNYPDGTILKEGADPSQVRKVPGNGKDNISDNIPAASHLGGGNKVEPIVLGGNNAPGNKPNPGGGGAGGGIGARPRRESNFGNNNLGGNNNNNNRLGGNNNPSGPSRGGVNNNGPGAGARRPTTHAGGGGANNRAGNLGDNKRGLDETWNAQKVYVGDRAKIRETGRAGDVMFVGRINSFGTGLVVGLKLDEKRRTSECDGRHGSERYFRCPPGYGVFLSIDEVEVSQKGTEKDSAASLENCRMVFEAPVGGSGNNNKQELDLEKELEKFYDAEGIKAQLRRVKRWVEVQRKRSEAANQQQDGSNDIGLKPLTFLFRGQLGTGKTTIARHLTHLLRDLGVINRGQLIETSRKELTASYGEGDKTVTKVWKAALGGVLFIDDIGQAADEKNDRSGGHTLEEALYSIMKHWDQISRSFTTWPQPMCLILSYPQNASLPERLQPIQNEARSFDFDDYNEECIAHILEANIKARNFSSTNIKSESLLNVVRGAVARGMGQEFPNALLAEKLLNDAIQKQTERVWMKDTMSWEGLTTLCEDDFLTEHKGQQEQRDALAKLEKIVGLSEVKSFVKSLHAQLSVEMQRRLAGINAGTASHTLHMIFTGSPGTGKTTVARVIAELLRSLGLLRKGHLIEADRSSLVAGYSGQTALKTKAVVESALGGVLFIDEAYALVQGDGRDSFGHEALDTLIKMTEDHRGNLVVILAGYIKEMQRLLDSNPGLCSRFPNKLNFENYTLDEMFEIGESMLLADNLKLYGGIQDKAGLAFKQKLQSLGANHGNGRSVRNILEEAKRNMAVRLTTMKRPTANDLVTLTADDFQ